ncbi:MAG: ATP-binding protein [Bryobacteraceae bacterium]
MAERARKRARLGMRLVLIAGFGGLLALMAAAGLDSVRALHSIESRNTAITQTYLARHRSLEHIRSSLYLSNASVRDYLLESTPEGARAARARLEELRTGTLEALQSYLSTSSLREAQLAADLDRQVRDYWASLAPIFQQSAEEAWDRRSRFLETHVFPKRASLLAIADRIDAINEQALRDGSGRTAAAFDSSRKRVETMLGIALGIGALFAAGSILYLLSLEKESRVRFQEVQRLSARLVDAQEQERRSISRELHDEVGQSLNALLVDLGNLAAITPPENVEAHQLLGTAKTLADHSVKALRNMALLLRPSMLDDFGLIPALHWQAREVSRRTGMRIDVDADEAADSFPEEYRTCIFRVVQEALHNSSRHAEAKTVRIGVRQDGEWILLTVEDDGRGFEATRVRGLGLIGMEERVKHLNGTFQVQSHSGTGTVLKIALPYAKSEMQVGVGA